jgi:hypothetical protein
MRPTRTHAARLWQCNRRDERAWWHNQKLRRLRTHAAAAPTSRLHAASAAQTSTTADKRAWRRHRWRRRAVATAAALMRRDCARDPTPQCLHAAPTRSKRTHAVEACNRSQRPRQTRHAATHTCHGLRRASTRAQRTTRARAPKLRHRCSARSQLATRRAFRARPRTPSKRVRHRHAPRELRSAVCRTRAWRERCDASRGANAARVDSASHHWRTARSPRRRRARRRCACALESIRVASQS